ncbi:MAG: hypothetical protein GXX95_06260 [Methanomassiliicoccus sp.]|nr:hypothetical protein [Methanomassiliicoccus sp.]
MNIKKVNTVATIVALFVLSVDLYNIATAQRVIPKRAAKPKETTITLGTDPTFYSDSMPTAR